MGSRDDIQSSYEDLRRRIEEFHEKAVSGTHTAVLFADLAGSTEYKSQRDLVSSLLKVYRHNEEILAQVTKTGGRVVKSLGDGIMATFDIKEPDDIIDPLKAATVIQKHFERANRDVRDDERIMSRIGIACGTVIDFRITSPSGTPVNDPQGPVVDLAARLCSLARPCQVLTDGQVAKLESESGGSFSLVGPVPRYLKGFALPIPVHVLPWSRKNAENTVPYLPPMFTDAGFLTSEFVLSLVADATSSVRLVGFSNRHFCDNIELYNLLKGKVTANNKFRFDLIFMNPFSPYKRFSQAMTRRKAADLSPHIIRNIKSACELFADMAGNIRIGCTDFPMAIPLIRVDDFVHYGLPFRSLQKDGSRVGVVGGPFFTSHADSEIGRRIEYTLENDNMLLLDIKAIHSGGLDLGRTLRSGY